MFIFLSPLIIIQCDTIFSIIKNINEEGTTILLIEQNATMALQIADRAYVIQNGSIQLSGNAHELLNDDNIKIAYLGA